MKNAFRTVLACTALSLSLGTVALAQQPAPQSPAPAADDVEVEVQGMGVARTDALSDALRAAVGKAAGVTLRSETTVENFMVVSDAIATNSQGYITSYNILNEGAAPAGYQVTIRARVSQKPLKADLNLLAQAVGGMRWMVAYDPRGLNPQQKDTYEAAVDRANQYLADKRYRFIDRATMERLQTEAANMLEADAAADSAELTYAQQLGMRAGAQFVILLGGLAEQTRSEAFDTRTATRTALSAKAFDNCTAEGLATLRLDGDWQTGRDAGSAARQSLEAAIANGMPKVMEQVLSYIGDWANNGVPFELRFYGLGGFRDLRAMRQKLQEDPLYGGQMEMTSVANYTRLNGTFKRRPEQMADRVLDVADQVPALAARRIDVRFMFGRQLNFAPTGQAIPELDQAAAIVSGGGAPVRPAPPMRTAAPAKNRAAAKPRPTRQAPRR